MPAAEKDVQLPVSLFKGLTVKPSAVNRDFNSAQLCSNFVKFDNGKGTTRPPIKNSFRRADYDPHQISFPFTYTYTDLDTNSTKERLLTLRMSMNASYAAQPVTLGVMEKQTGSIAYSGSGDCIITLRPVLSGGVRKWQLIVTENGATTIFQTLDSGASFAPTTLSALLVILDARPTLTVSPSPPFAGTASATSVDMFPQTFTILNGGSTNFTYYEEGTSYGGGDAPKKFTDADFIIPSALNYANVIYFAYGTYEYKYDGHLFYRSGLPQAEVKGLAEVTGSTFSVGETYIYKVVSVRYDAKNNIIEGEDSDDTLLTATITLTGTKDIRVTFDDLLDSDWPEFEIHSAIINGTQTNTNAITVLSGHNMIEGDTAYLYDESTNEYITRNVVSVGATDVTIDGDPVDVGSDPSGSYISNNVRLQLWRTKNGGTDFYFVDEVPNDNSANPHIYVDDTPDTDLTEPYVDQLRKHTLPPKCSFIGTHQGLKITAGDPDNPNRIAWALPQDFEGYPIESNNTDIKAGGLGGLTGFGTSSRNKLAVFKYNGHAILDGTLDDLSFETDDRSNTGIGCTSFRSLAHIGDSEALCGLSAKGVFIFAGDTPSLALGDGVNPLLYKIQTPQVNGTAIPDSNWYSEVIGLLNFSLELVLKRAIAINDTIDGKYHLYIPSEAGVPGEQKVPIFTASKYLVYDYLADIPYWSEYSFFSRYHNLQAGVDANVSANAGFTLYDNELWLGGAIYGNGADTEARLWKYDVKTGDKAEAGYPVYLDIHYNPFTREINAATAFFKTLWVNIYKFLNDILADPSSDESLGNDFSFSIKTIKDYKNYPSPSFKTNALKKFKVANGQTCVPTKCVTDKCRAFQVQLTNGDNLITDFEPPVFDSVELIYTTPYDPKTKDPKGVRNG